MYRFVGRCDGTTVQKQEAKVLRGAHRSEISTESLTSSSFTEWSEGQIVVYDKKMFLSKFFHPLNFKSDQSLSPCSLYAAPVCAVQFMWVPGWVSFNLDYYYGLNNMPHVIFSTFIMLQGRFNNDNNWQ